MQVIDAVLALNQPRRILVGVRGVTGSGKSTLINALLGTGYLLPMQPGKACTAVVVEVAYNYSNDPEGFTVQMSNSPPAQNGKKNLKYFSRT